MKRLLPLLIVLLTLVFRCQLGQDDAFSATSPSLATGTEQQWQQDDQRHRESALFTDASHLYRICNTRPQRFHSSQSTKNERTSGKLPLALRHHQHYSLHQAPSGEHVPSLPRFHFFASRIYYVYALRHILR